MTTPEAHKCAHKCQPCAAGLRGKASVGRQGPHLPLLLSPQALPSRSPRLAYLPGGTLFLLLLRCPESLHPPSLYPVQGLWGRGGGSEPAILGP